MGAERARQGGDKARWAEQDVCGAVAERVVELIDDLSGGVQVVQCVGGFQIEPELFGIFDEEPVAGEPTQDPLDETVEQAREGLRVGCPDAMEPGAVLFHGVDPIQNQHVAMGVQVQGAAEALDHGDDANARAATGREFCPMGQIALNGSDDD